MTVEGNCRESIIGNVDFQKALSKICRSLPIEHVLRHPDPLQCHKLRLISLHNIDDEKDMKHQLAFFVKDITAVTMLPMSILMHVCYSYMSKKQKGRGVSERSFHNFDMHVLQNLSIGASSTLSPKRQS